MKKPVYDVISDMDKLVNNRADGNFTIAMSTDIDTSDINILNKVTRFYDAPAVEEAQAQSIIFLKEYLDALNLDYIKAPEYYQGVSNPNSYFIFGDEYIARELVENANEWFGQESIIAFGPDCSFKVYDTPVDYSTKLDDNNYVVFEFDGTVFETEQTAYYDEEEQVPLTERFTGTKDSTFRSEPITRPAVPGSKINLEPLEYDETRKTEELGGYRIAHKNTAEPGEHNYENIRGWTEDELVSAVYNVAPIIYNSKTRAGVWDNTSYTEEDFTQEAALYALGLFRKNYFNTDYDILEPIVYRMLNSHFVWNVSRRERREYKRNEPSLNRKYSNSDREYLDSEVDYNTRSVSDKAIYDEDIEEGKKIVDEIIELLDFKPYRTRKHTYIGNDEELGQIELTEKNIALLLLRGNSARDIIRIYGKEVDNIGASSEASFVSHKIKDTINNMAFIINNLDEDERDSVKTYLRFLES